MVAPRTSRTPLAETITFAALVAFAMVLRVREALRTPLWFDELYTRAAVERPWHDVMRIVHADVHPPLHFAYAWAWRVFGDGDLEIRASSLAVALGVLALTATLARRLFGRDAALLALALVAFDPWHVYLSQEARSYPLLWLGLLASALGAWNWGERGRKRDAALFVAGSVVALWTHYLAGVLLAVQAAWGVAALARDRRRLAGWIGLHAIVALAFAPNLPLVWAQFHRIEGDHWLKPPDWIDTLDVARRFTFGNPRLLVPMLALALWPLGDPKARRAATLALAIGPLSVLVCWVLGVNGVRVFALKYMMFALAPWYALVGAGAVRLPWRPLRGLVAAGLLVYAAHAFAVHALYPEARSMRLAHASLGTRVAPGDLLFTSDTHAFLFARHYYPAARTRLLLEGQRLPYYEGAAVIPDSVRGEGAEIRAAAAGGAGWWALAWGRGGVSADAFAATADSLAGAPAERCDLVRVWRGAAIGTSLPRR